MLVELMIVIALIAAIAIPRLTAAMRASNERSSSAEADFRANDRDGNKSLDFWTLDVAPVPRWRWRRQRR